MLSLSIRAGSGRRRCGHSSITNEMPFMDSRGSMGCGSTLELCIWTQLLHHDAQSSRGVRGQCRCIFFSAPWRLTETDDDELARELRLHPRGSIVMMCEMVGENLSQTLLLRMYALEQGGAIDNLISFLETFHALFLV